MNQFADFSIRNQTKLGYSKATKERTLLLILVTERTYGRRSTSQRMIPAIMMEQSMMIMLVFVDVEDLYQAH